MAILSDRDLRELIEERDAVYVEEGPEIDMDLQLGPSSFDLRLGYSFGILNTRKIEMVDTKDMGKYQKYIEEERHSPEEGVIIHPGEFILGSSLETINIPDDLVARVEGRSSYGRLGIVVHATAGFCDPGFEGDITLEMQNLGNAPVKLYPEDRICQVVFETMTSEADTPYGDKTDAKYQGQQGATGSKLDREQR
ncbi:MAG: dCTP deaminase [Candidatus Nanohaloarchaea archaeon]|nr:dCTP deaminase [Candidatus Nanohaloarchaea archaeon]